MYFSGFRWTCYGTAAVAIDISLAMTLGFVVACVAGRAVRAAPPQYTHRYAAGRAPAAAGGGRRQLSTINVSAGRKVSVTMLAPSRPNNTIAPRPR